MGLIQSERPFNEPLDRRQTILVRARRKSLDRVAEANLGLRRYKAGQHEAHSQTHPQHADPFRVAMAALVPSFTHFTQGPGGAAASRADGARRLPAPTGKAAAARRIAAR